MLRESNKEEFDIIIQAGQSNSEGSGLGVATEPFVQIDDVLYLNNDFSISIASERIIENEIIGDFSLSFAGKYINEGELKPGRKLLILRAAVGGTGFLDNRWGITDDLFLRMIEMIKTALNLNPKNKLVAFLWHQGETDAILNALRDIHYKNLDTLVKTVRSTFNCQNLPFIAADFVNQWKNDNMTICFPVIEAIKNVCSDNINAKFIETSGLQSNDQMVGNGDTIHFSREALNLLGIKYFEAYKEISQ